MIHKRSKGLRNKVSLRQQVSSCYFHEWETVLTVSLEKAFFFPMENIRLLLPGAFESPSLSLPLFRLWPVSLTFGWENSRVPPLSSCGMYIYPWLREESHHKAGAHFVRISPNSGQFWSQCEWPWASAPSASSFCHFLCPLAVLGLELCLCTGNTGIWSSDVGEGPISKVLRSLIESPGVEGLVGGWQGVMLGC